MYIIYCHINKINQKKYIGQTCQKPTKRWGYNGKNYEHNLYFYNAIQKYGWDNFQHIILEQNILTQEQANKREKYWIKIYHSNDKEYGYNLTDGGNSNYSFNEQTRQKISNNLKIFYQTHPIAKQQQIDHLNNIRSLIKYSKQHNQHISQALKGRKLSEQHKKKISQAHKGKKLSQETKRKISEGNKGKKLSQETKRKISESNKGKIHGHQSQETIQKKIKAHQKPIICITTNKIFNSIKEGAIYYNVDASSISKVLKGKRKSAGKNPINNQPLKWKYIEQLDKDKYMEDDGK